MYYIKQIIASKDGERIKSESDSLKRIINSYKKDLEDEKLLLPGEKEKILQNMIYSQRIYKILQKHKD